MGHGIEEKLKVVGYLNSVLIFAIEEFPFASLVSGDALLMELIVNKMIEIPRIVKNKGYRFSIHDFILQMLKLEHISFDLVQLNLLNITYLLYLILADHIDIGCLLVLRFF